MPLEIVLPRPFSRKTNMYLRKTAETARVWSIWAMTCSLPSFPCTQHNGNSTLGECSKEYRAPSPYASNPELQFLHKNSIKLQLHVAEKLF